MQRKSLRFGQYAGCSSKIKLKIVLEKRLATGIGNLKPQDYPDPEYFNTKFRFFDKTLFT